MEHATYGGFNPGKEPRLILRPSAHTTYHHRTRARVINYWRQGADVLTVSLPTTPSERTRKSGPLQPEHATWHVVPGIFAQSKLAFWRNLTKGRYTGTRANAVWGRCPTACAFFFGKAWGALGELCRARHCRPPPLERLPRLAFAHNRRIYLPKTALAAHASLCPSFSAHTYLKQQLQPLQITNLQSEDLTLQKA
jgi:hypothetical protein